MKTKKIIVVSVLCLALLVWMMAGFGCKKADSGAKCCGNPEAEGCCAKAPTGNCCGDPHAKSCCAKGHVHKAGEELKEATKCCGSPDAEDCCAKEALDKIKL